MAAGQALLLLWEARWADWSRNHPTCKGHTLAPAQQQRYLSGHLPGTPCSFASPLDSSPGVLNNQLGPAYRIWVSPSQTRTYDLRHPLDPTIGFSSTFTWPRVTLAHPTPPSMPELPCSAMGPRNPYGSLRHPTDKMTWYRGTDLTYEVGLEHPGIHIYFIYCGNLTNRNKKDVSI